MSKYGYSFNARSANSGSFKEPVYICGQIVKLNNGCPKPNRWLSGKIRSADGELYPVAGTGSIMLAVGDMVECDADEEYSDNYGVQYKVRRQSMIVPIASSEDEVISYLSGPAFKGVGVVTAKKLFDIYGKWTIPTISDNLFALTAKFHGISDSVIRVLQDGMRESSIFRRFSSVFPHLPATAINRIVEQSDKSFNFFTFVDSVNSNPYVMLHETYGVRIKDTDSVALYDCHISFDADVRLAFMMKLAIRSFCQARHATYVRINDEHEWYNFFLYSFMKDVGSHMAEPFPDTFSSKDLRIWLNQFSRRNQKSNPFILVDGGVVNPSYPYGFEPRIDVNGNPEYALYSTDLYNAEHYLCDVIRDMSQLTQSSNMIKKFSHFYKDGIAMMPDELQQSQLSHPLDSIQLDAVKMPWKYRLSFITGGPGRGKTSCLAAMIYAWLRMKNRSVILLAPTGKAIKRMQQQTGYSCASTIARFLMLNKKNDKLSSGEMFDPLKNQVVQSSNVLVVVDEASMLSFTEAKELLMLIKDCTVVFVGDKDQLPPIEAGPFLHQCLDSHITHVTELKENYRSGKCDWVGNPERILQGGTMKDLKKTMDFMVIPASEDIQDMTKIDDPMEMSPAEQYIVQEYASCVQQDEYSGVMLLTPFAAKKLPLSSSRLNCLLQEKLNPKMGFGNFLKVQGMDPFSGRMYYEGRGKDTVLKDSNGVSIRTNDRIMNTKNFPEQKILLFKNNSMEMRDALDERDIQTMFGSVPCGIYNGDIGIVRRVYCPFGRNSYQMLVELEGDSLKLNSGVQGKTTSFSRFTLIDVGDDGATFDNWVLAYALSIHKAQGCEATHVIVTIPKLVVGMDGNKIKSGVEPFITRNMFYTAVTRSSQTVTLVGEVDALNEFMRYPYCYSNVRLTDLLDGKVK